MTVADRIAEWVDRHSICSINEYREIAMLFRHGIYFRKYK